MSRHRKELEVRFIRYTQDVIDDTFDDGTRLNDTLDGLRNKRYKVNDKIPKITVVKKDEIYFCQDNRELWVLKGLAAFLEETENVVLKVPVKFGKLENLKMTTTTEGEDVRLRHKGSTEEFRTIKSVELSTIRYSSDKIYGFSRSGEYEIKSFLSNYRDPSQLPVLDVVKRNGKLYALDNRQLWLVKHWFQKKPGGVDEEEKQHSPNMNIDDSKDSSNNENDIDSQDLEGAVARSVDTDRVNMETQLSSDKQEVRNKNFGVEVHDDVVVVEMKPYDTFLGYTALVNEGISIRLVQEAEPERNKPKKNSHLKYKPLTRQSPSNDRRSVMRYAEAYRKQPLETIKKK
ncbi:uncharacterized protein LOC132743393 isoform X1 [Ruditapes philippinarum]|uniref:uncharacterized protein LOC132743393 isoform X1 n=1 Tax=Ruditapes philippinarum TaxID=129788 RepID=UPI00295BC30A|nr:uncharacterized protein LOC132743393 isoform X1 [Ruditapes philippinarum]